jgi:hypothetical protein
VNVAAITTSAAQSDTILFALSFSSNVVGDPLLLRFAFNGGQPATDSTQVPVLPDSGSQAIGVAVIIPANAPDGTFTLTAVLPTFGDSSSASVKIQDTRPPTLVAFVFPATQPAPLPVYAFGPFALVAGGDSIQWAVGDNHAVAWAGWALGPPANLRDSIAVTGTSAITGMPMTVPATLAGTAPELTAFARDVDDNLTTESFGPTAIAQYVHHPTVAASLDTIPDDIVYDAKRNVLYMVEHQRPGIAVFSLATMSYQQPIVLPVPPIDLDITPGGDTLVASLTNTADVAFVNLVTAPHPISTLHLSALDATPGDTTNVLGYAAAVRIAADNRAIIGAEGPGFTGVVELNLTTVSDSTVPLPVAGFFGRSGDRTKVVLPGIGTEYLSIYDATTHTISPVPVPGFNLSPPASANSTGSAITVGLNLFTPSSYVGSLSIQLAPYGANPAATLTGAGTSVFVGTYAICDATGGSTTVCPATTAGFLLESAVSLAPNPLSGLSGQLIEVSDTPELVSELLMLLGDTQLIAIGQSHIFSIDLTHSSPGVPAQVAAHRLPRPSAHPSSVSASAMSAQRLDVRLRIGRTERTMSLSIGPACTLGCPR